MLGVGSHRRSDDIAEAERHAPVAIPTRRECPECVHATGVYDQRRAHASNSEEPMGVTISFDYCFQTGADEEGLESRGNQTLLVTNDILVAAMLALHAKPKGVRAEVVDWVMQEA